MTDNRIRVSAYFADEAQRQRAEEALDETEAFSGVIEGTAHPDKLASLIEAGVVLELLETANDASRADFQRIEIAPPASDGAESEFDALQYFKALTQGGPLSELQWPPSSPSETAPTKALEEQGYEIQLTGPITRHQRLELDSLGVDIAAFKSPDRYRTILRQEQYEKVRLLPYVSDIRIHAIDDTVTNAFLKFVQTTHEPRSALANEEYTGSPRLYDVLVHRERDLPIVRELIERIPNTEIVGTSNLRVRFATTCRLSMLAALADRVEVRKLDLFESPSI